MTSKATAQQRHAQRRAAERFCASWSRRDLNAIVRLIQTGKADFVGRQSLRVTRWRITYEGVTADIVYDKQRHTIVTVLFPDGRA